MPDVDWAALRVEYEDRKGPILAVLAAKYGVSMYEINQQRIKEEWKPRKERLAARQVILARVYRILDAQTLKMENAMLTGEPVGMADLNSVTRTLERLLSLNKAEDRSRRKAPESAAIKALRAKLAERIDQLNQG